MICTYCQAEVDDDLIFCTNCGERLFEPQSKLTQNIDAAPPKSSSKLKWTALIAALIAIPALIFGIFLFANSNQKTISNQSKTASTPARPKAADQNSNANRSIANSENANVNTNGETKPEKGEIMNERIEIAAGSNYAVPFKVEAETAKIIGEIKVLEGEKIDGFVFLQQMYDEHFPDETYKMYSFGGAGSITTNQTLVKENYVLVFVNDTEKPVMIEAKFSAE